MQPHDALERWLDNESLSAEEAEALMTAMLGGEVADAKLGGMLVALRLKGPVVDELVGFARALRAQAVRVEVDDDRIVDNCGTGGGPHTWNLSTGAAIVAAAAGAKVGKHGNRAVTSSCGSADVLEALGVKLAETPEEASRHLGSAGIAFLFATHFHPGLKVLGPARRALGVRTVFNLLGPLLNPAGARRQLVGIYDARLLRTMAQTLGELGADRAWVVAAEDGLDEVSPVFRTHVAAWQDGHVQEFSVGPEDFGVHGPVDLAAGATVEENARILESALSPGNPHLSEALIPNAAVTLWLAGLVQDLKIGADLARDTVASGAARARLEAWRGASA